MKNFPINNVSQRIHEKFSPGNTETAQCTVAKAKIFYALFTDGVNIYWHACPNFISAAYNSVSRNLGTKCFALSK